MKKILFATTALVMTAGAAAAEVRLAGDARMGVLYDGDDWGFTSRARLQFNMSGETDGGLTFGASFRVNDEGAQSGARQASTGTRGTVFIAGDFGRLAMGAPAGAAEAAVGDLYEVGLTGLAFYNEVDYLTGDGAGINGAWNPTVLYSYTFGDFSFYASASDGNNAGGRVENPATDEGSQDYSVAVAWASGDFKVGVAYESSEVTTVAGGVATTADTQDQWVLGGEATFGDFGLKAIYVNGARNVAGGVNTYDYEEYGLSGSATFDLVTVTAFARETRQEFPVNTLSNRYYGIGARYDLGGGASLVGGIGHRDVEYGSALNAPDTYGDFGIAFRF
ncbi:porin [Halodurantibacterium flavum]|uniref:Porin n=1 Tax=Halodurantibacterium flavum TaxID=1382802 RepID=A0ABW4S820_9RHOB